MKLVPCLALGLLVGAAHCRAESNGTTSEVERTVILSATLPVFSLREPYPQVGELNPGATVTILGDESENAFRIRFIFSEGTRAEAQCKMQDLFKAVGKEQNNAISSPGRGNMGAVEVIPHLAPHLSADDFAVTVKQCRFIFSPGGEARTAILQALRQAKSTVDVAMFYLRDENLIDALCFLAAQRNIRVRVLVDSQMNAEAQRPFLHRLSQNGVQVHVNNLDEVKGQTHLKMAIVDNETVITGCANWTSEAFGQNFEDTVILQSPALAERYRRFFDGIVGTAEAYYQSDDQGKLIRKIQWPSAVAIRRSPIAGFRQSKPLQFSNVQVESFHLPNVDAINMIRDRLSQAQRSIYVGMYLLSNPEIIDALCEMAQKVSVRILVDQSSLEKRHLLGIQKLSRSGAQVSVYSAQRSIMHLKVAIVDEGMLITGSANWTIPGLTENQEDILIISDAGVAAYYKLHLKNIAEVCTPYIPSDLLDIPNEGETQAGPINGYFTGLPPTGPRTCYSNIDITQPTTSVSYEYNAWVKYIQDEEYFPAALKLVESASQTIQVAMYAIPKVKGASPYQDGLMKRLIAAANRGVYVMLLLEMPNSPSDRLSQHHSIWANELRAHGIDVRFNMPSRSLHAKAVIVDQCKLLIGSHNWSEGALSGRRVFESSCLVVLDRQDMRWVEYFEGQEIVSDMRSPALWEQEIERLRTLGSIRGSAQRDLAEEYLGIGGAP